jgi:hypothetical protein
MSVPWNAVGMPKMSLMMLASVPCAAQISLSPRNQARLTAIARVDNVEHGRRVPTLPPREVPRRRLEHRPRRVLDVHRVRLQVAVPQEPHLGPLALVHARQRQRRAQEPRHVRPVHVGHAQHQQVQPGHLGQVALGPQLPLGEAAPRLEARALVARRRAAGLVHHARGALDEAAHAAAGGLAAEGEGRRVGAGGVDGVVLRQARLAGAVDDDVEGLAVGAVEDARQVLWIRSA